MTATTLNPGGDQADAARWVKRAVAVVSCAVLAVALGVVFTRVIAARVPQQRASLEKLITEHTGLAVRFEDVRLAWKLDGASAVFTRVELEDPHAGRVRVWAPELRVELDTWDYLRNQRFSLGNVKLASPDIEIIGDAEPAAPAAVRRRALEGSRNARPLDEAAILRRYLAWAELMPSGRIEVEGARVHLRRRGEPAPRHSFTLSQAVVSRGSGTLNAHGTMLLSQDLGQSLFVSAKLEGLRAGASVSGDLRFIARRVLLERLLPGVDGRGTLDAKLHLEDGRVGAASWQASARELRLHKERSGPRFDHVSFRGKLKRDASDVLLAITDMQVSRGAQLQRAAQLDARLRLEPGMTGLSGATLRSARLPFMTAELLIGLLPEKMASALPAAPEGWQPSAGELHEVHIETAMPDGVPRDWTLTAGISGGALERVADEARVTGITARLRGTERVLTLEFDPAQVASLQLAPDQPERPWSMSGAVSLQSTVSGTALSFEAFSVTSGASTLSLAGAWQPGSRNAPGLQLQVAQVDRGWLRDVHGLLAPQTKPPAWWPDIAQGQILAGAFEVRADAAGGVDWRRSRGALSFAELATVGKTLPVLSAARGSVELDRGATRLIVEGGQVEDLDIQNARIEWPRRGAPRLQASLTGSLDSATLGAVLRPHGLGQLRGTVSLEADARGAEALHQPDLWRVTAQVRDARVSLGSEMPAIEALSGKIRYAGRQLRGLELAGRWLDGPVRIVSQRGGARAPLTFAGSGEADAAALLALVNGSGPMPQVTGELPWNGAAEFSAADGIWNISLTSTLVGLTSELPKPFAKARSRQVPVNASLSVAPEGLRMFEIESGRDFAVRGDLQQGRWLARFEVQGISGELRRVTRGAGDPELQIESLEIDDAPAVLSAAGHFLPHHEKLAVTVNDLRAGSNSLGALNAAISRRESGIDFSLDSPAATLHRVTAHGECSAQTCRMEFTADTAHLAALLRSARLPPEWPVQSLHAMGSLHWPAVEGGLDIRALGGEFSFTAQGMGAEHQASARATLQDGDILLTEVQGTGPEPDQMFRGQGRIGLVARDYDLSVDYERIVLASNAVPSSTRARLARAWNAVRGSAARQGWTEAPDTRRVQWHGSWEDAR